jgi:HAD superfamily hydrolase (TIGR01490 family)
VNIAVFDLDRTVTDRGSYTPWLFRFIRRHPARLLGVPFALAAALAYQFSVISRKRLKEIMLRIATAGLPAAELAEVTRRFVADWVPGRCRPGALAAIARHREAGDRVILATASLDIYAREMARALGISEVVATCAERHPDGRLTGRIDGPNCYGNDKLAMVQAVLAAAASDGRVTVYTDHHTDMPLFNWSGAGVAVNPNQKLINMVQGKAITVVDWGRPEGAER